ncbi:MAG: PAS domain S-box protein [Lentisphaerae bacterium]|nr:PAS domain S-box protein [Lentisphaerota bacterium]
MDINHTDDNLDLFDSVPDGVFIESVDGYVLYANAAACALHGLSQEELIGKHVTELVPPDVKDAVRARFPKWISGELTEFHGFSRQAGGKSVRVCIRGQRMEFRGEPALLLLVREERARYEAERALQESETRFRQLVEHAPEAIVLVDMETGCFAEVNANAEKLYGLSREQLLRMGPAELSPPRQPDGSSSEEKAREYLRRAAQGELISIEWTHLNAAGDEVPCEVRLLALNWGDKTMMRASVIDVTDRKRTQEREAKMRQQLARARRLESVALLAGGVAHDLNNILGPLVGYPDLLLDDLADDSPLRQPLVDMRNAARRASDVIMELLTLARQGDANLAPLALDRLVSELIASPELARHRANRPEVEVVTHLESGLPLIQGQHASLMRLLMNLVLNALEAMPQGGRLDVSLTQQILEQSHPGFDMVPPGHYVVLAVKDNGEGIDPAKVEQIFDPFYSTRNRKGRVSGLGLAVAYGIVHDNGGYIDVTSQPGRGACFATYLPATDNGPAPDPEQTAIPTGLGSILVVDDVEEQRQLACLLLRHLGYTTEAVPDGHAAVERVMETPFDLILLDMVMEDDFDGLDTFRALRELRPGLACLIVSGYAESDRIREAVALGAGPCLPKPYTLSELAQAISAALPQETV